MPLFARVALVLTTAALVACGSPPGQPAAGDGTLDCEEGLVSRDAGVRVVGGSESEVVGEALSRWVNSGADLVEHPPSDSWAAVEDGRDVAVAHPEVEGDGTWVVHDVRVCGEPDTGPAPTDGGLDCPNDAYWDMQAGFDVDVPGEPTPEEAIRHSLDPYRDAYGGEIALVDETTGSLVADSREHVIATVIEVPAGGWAVSVISGCKGYEL